MQERFDPIPYSPERLLQDLEATAHSILAPFDGARTRRALEVFDAEFRSCVVQLKAADRPASGVYYRFFYNGARDLTRLALDNDLIEGDGPNVRLQDEVLQRFAGATRAGLDFDSSFGLAKVWTFTGGPTPVAQLQGLRCLPESLRAHRDFFAEHGLRNVFFFASDYQGSTMNVYFGWEDDCRNPEWIARMVQATGGAAPTPELTRRILESQAMSGGVGLTFSWDRPELLRWCLYSLEVPGEVDLPERLQIFQEAPSLNREPQLNVAWSFGGSRTYVKLEKSYARDATHFLTQQMGGDLRGAACKMPELRQRSLLSAWQLFAEQGFDETSMAQVAARSQVPLQELYQRFARKEDLVFALYRHLALQLEERLEELPAGTLRQRFARAMDAKIASLQPHRAALQGLFDTMLQRERDLGVFSENMQLIRRRVRGVFYYVALGASDRPTDTDLEATVSHLYRLHLALVFLWFRQPRLYPAARRLTQGTLGLLEFAPIQKLLRRVDELLPETAAVSGDPAEQILRRLFRHRRLQHQDGCAQHPCAQCLALHLPRVQHFVERGLPIQLVLPAFPAKSPNLGKVLGHRPDTAERLALRVLQTVCEEIGEIYAPGAQLTICSDGHVFSDLVGVADETVTAYNTEIRQLLEEMQLDRLSFFNLQDLYSQPDYAQVRAELLPQFSEPLQQVRTRVKEVEAQRHLFDGLHRFLFEDHAATHPGLSRNRARQVTKELTYQVLARSNAWGRILGLHFPEALRLSIHPQAAHSDKIGILLTPALDNWVTPWHGVALLRDQDFLLVKRQQAEEGGARLYCENQRPLHFIQES